MKLLHELGSYGMVGGFAAQLLLLLRAEGPDAPVETIQDLTLWITAPSFAVVALSGLLVMVVRPVFFTKGWVWLKVFLTVPTLYVVVATFPGLANLDPTRLDRSLSLAIGASIVITWASVWRPKALFGLR